MTDILLTHGSYFVITLVLILTGAGLPVPEEVPIVAAGLLSGRGVLNPFIAFGCCLFGALAGDCIMYWLGYHFGRGVLRERHWWSRLITPEREARLEREFQRHGFKVFFVSRFLIGIRSPVYLTAGIMQVSFKRFILIDLVCATVVVGTFFGLTYLFGQYVPQLIHKAEIWLTIAVVLALIVLTVYLVRRYRQKLFAPTTALGEEDAEENQSLLLPETTETVAVEDDPMAEEEAGPEDIEAVRKV